MGHRRRDGRKQKRQPDITSKYVELEAEKVVAERMQKFLRFLPLHDAPVLAHNMSKCGERVNLSEHELMVAPTEAELSNDPTMHLPGAPKLHERRVGVILPSMIKDSRGKYQRRGNQLAPHFSLGPNLDQVNINLKRNLSKASVDILCEVFMSYSAVNTPLHFYGLDSDKFLFLCRDSQLLSTGRVTEENIKQVYNDTLAAVHFHLDLRDWLWTYSLETTPDLLKGLTRFAAPGKILGFPEWISAMCKVACLALFGHDKPTVAEVSEAELLHRCVTEFFVKFASRRRLDKLGVILCSPAVSHELLARQWTIWKVFLHYSGAQISDGMMDIQEIDQFCKDFSIVPHIAVTTMQHLFAEVLGVETPEEGHMHFAAFMEFLGRVGIFMYPPRESNILHALVGRYRCEFDAPILGAPKKTTKELNRHKSIKEKLLASATNERMECEVVTCEQEQARSANEIMAMRHPWSVSVLSRERMKRNRLVPLHVRAQRKFAVPDLNQRLPRAATPKAGRGMRVSDLARVSEAVKGEEWVRVNGRYLPRKRAALHGNFCREDHVKTKHTQRRQKQLKLAALQRTRLQAVGGSSAEYHHGHRTKIPLALPRVLKASHSAPNLGKSGAKMSANNAPAPDESVLVGRDAGLAETNGVTIERMMALHLNAMAMRRRRGSTGGVDAAVKGLGLGLKSSGNYDVDSSAGVVADDGMVKWEFYCDGERHIMADADTLLRQLEEMAMPETPDYMKLNEIEDDDEGTREEKIWITMTTENGDTQRVKVSRPLVSRASMMSRSSGESATPTAGGDGGSCDVTQGTNGREPVVRSRNRGPLASELKCGL